MTKHLILKYLMILDILQLLSLQVPSKAMYRYYQPYKEFREHDFFLLQEYNFMLDIMSTKYEK